MKYLLFLTVLLCGKVRAIETYITFNPLNCINCTSGIYHLSEEKYIKNIQVVFQEMYREDTADMQELYAFRDYPKLHIVFSDSLYKKLSHTDLDAEFIIIGDNHTELYRTSMKRLNMSEIRRYYATTPLSDSICSSFYPKMLSFQVDGQYIIAENAFHKFSIFDVTTQKEIILGYKDSIKVPLYKALYKEKFNERFPLIENEMKTVSSFKPTLDFVKRWDRRRIMAIYTVRDWMIEGKDTPIFNKPLVTMYDANTNATTIYTMDTTIANHYWVYNVHTHDNKFYLEGGLKGDDDKPAFIEVTCDTIKKTFSFAKSIISSYPQRYSEFKVPGIYESNTVVKAGLAAFVYDNKITNLATHEQVTIPYEDPKPAKYDTYQVTDLQQDAKNYYVLYTHKEQLHVLQFAKNDTLKKDIVIATEPGSKLWQVKFSMYKNKLFYKPADKDCLMLKDIIQ